MGCSTVTGFDTTQVDKCGLAASTCCVACHPRGFAAAGLRHGSAASSSALATRVDVSKAVQDSERDLLNIGANRSVTTVEIVVLR